ncbi:MAG: hypothetical protein IIT65_09860 [Lachnospiraceae bacterium]|nr:hypothetical protein [Lachnospiraceae bacterium]
MAKYTMYLRDVCDFYTREEVESWFKSYKLEDYLTQNEIDTINQRGTFSKDRLAKKIVDHYFMREIGAETPALFRHYALITMEEIMESKLPLIYSAAIKYDPLINVDYTETFERTIDGTSSSSGSSESSSTNNGSGLNINSDTPQGQIDKESILNGTYASSTSASETEASITDNTATTNEGASNTSENYSKTMKGNSGVSATAQKMIEQYRENIRAIDYEIIRELNDLFMGLF